MFIVFNKDKVISYLISLSTVAILFVMSFVITNKNNESVKTSTNILSNRTTEENVNNNLNEIKENKIST